MTSPPHPLDSDIRTDQETDDAGLYGGSGSEGGARFNREPAGSARAVRRARREEANRIGELTLLAYAADGFISPDDDYAAELTDADGRLAEAEVWVATVAGAVRGTVTFCPPGSPYRELAREREGEFRMLAIDPAARGMGLARALVQRCLDRCTELGLDEVVLCSMAEMGVAHRLYESMGFVRDPSLDWEPARGVVLLGFRAPVAVASP